MRFLKFFDHAVRHALASNASGFFRMLDDEDRGNVMSSVNKSDSEFDIGRSRALNRRQPQRSLFRRLFMMIIGWFDLRMRRRRSRLTLHELKDAQLRDIGLSRNQIDWKIRTKLRN
jgi:uncharacterized protein YjiS (DUF1127 family)